MYHVKEMSSIFRTVHDDLHVAEQTIDNLHGLRCSHPRFLHSEPV